MGRSGAAPLLGREQKIQFRGPIRLDARHLLATNLLSCAMAPKRPPPRHAPPANKLLPAARSASPRARLLLVLRCESLGLFGRFLNHAPARCQRYEMSLPFCQTRWKRQNASCENSPADGYLPIPRNPNSLPPPTFPIARSSLPISLGPARTAQTIRFAPRVATPHPPSYRFSGLALAEDCLGVADAAISGASLHCASAPAGSELFRTALRSVSCAHLLSASGNLFQTMAAVRIEFARRAPQAPAPPA